MFHEWRARRGSAAPRRVNSPKKFAGGSPVATHQFPTLRRLSGAALFRSSRPSSSWCFPSWHPGLTFRRSRPPTAASELKALVPRRNRFIHVMLFQMAFSFSGVMQRLACRFSGLRLRAVCLFQAFLAAGPCVASASSYHFASIAPPRWRFAFSQFAPFVKLGLPVLASGSNFSSQPTAFGVG